MVKKSVEEIGEGEVPYADPIKAILMIVARNDEGGEATVCDEEGNPIHACACDNCIVELGKLATRTAIRTGTNCFVVQYGERKDVASAVVVAQGGPDDPIPTHLSRGIQ